MDPAGAARGDAHDCRRNPSFKSMDNGPQPEENLLPPCEPQMKDNGLQPEENLLPPCEPQMKDVSSTGYVLISCQKQLSHKVLVKWISSNLIGSTLL